MTQVDVAVTISPEETITQLCLDELIKYKRLYRYRRTTNRSVGELRY